MYGIWYYPKVGIPSLLSDTKHYYHNYNPIEREANALSFSYQNIYSVYDNSKPWNLSRFPITGYNLSNPFNNTLNQTAINNNIIGWRWFDFIFGPTIRLGLINDLDYNAHGKKYLNRLYAIALVSSMTTSCLLKNAYLFQPLNEHTSIVFYNNSDYSISIVEDYDFSQPPAVLNIQAAYSGNSCSSGESLALHGYPKEPYDFLVEYGEHEILNIYIYDQDESLAKAYDRKYYNDNWEYIIKTDTAKYWKARYDLRKGDLQKAGWLLSFPPDSTMSHIHVEYP